MTLIYAIAIAVLGLFIAVGHSMIGERYVLAPLYREPQQGVLKSRSMKAILRTVWHMPSLTWAVLGCAVLTARLAGGIMLVSLTAGFIFALSGLGNLIALRRPHLGGLALLAAAALAVIDWRTHV